MKHATFSALTVFILVGLTGCVTQFGRRPWTCMGGSCAQAPENCQSCDDQCCEEPGRDGFFNPGRCCRMGRDRGYRARGEEGITPGPPTGTITYPYYTIRGPRDFLADNPPSIGP